MSTVSTSDWIKGISLSVLASIIGGASKLAIRKSWLMQRGHDEVDGAAPSSRTAPMSTDSYHAIEQEQGPSYFIDGGQEVGHRHSALDDGDESSLRSNSNHNSYSSFEDGQLQVPMVIRRRDTVKMCAWCLRGSGMIGMTFLNPACCVLAMNYASPSILAPFSGLTLVWIVLLSQPLIQEKPTVRQIIAASLIVLGEVLVAVFGDHTNQEDMTIAKVTASYKEPPFLAYIVGTLLWIVLLVVWMKYSTNATLRRFAWGIAGGSMTGAQNFLKDALTIVKVKGEHEDLPWYFFLLLFFAVLTAFVGLLFLTACMKRYDATYSAAMFVGSFVVSASIMSAVHYSTFQHLQGIVNWILYPAGLLVLMVGVWMLIKEKGARVIDDDEDDDVVVVAPQLPEHSEDDSIITGSSGSHDLPRVELQPLFV